MKSIGIITIHKINNYGSVLQAYALQKVCEELGYDVEVIDYDFPNDFHRQHVLKLNDEDSSPTQNEPKWIKALFGLALMRQHKGIRRFVKHYLHLSNKNYTSPEQLSANPPIYDIYITGSDQLWSPRHCQGDPTFMLHFAPDEALKISYAASIGSDNIPNQLITKYKELLGRYAAISVRETSGAEIIERIIGSRASIVLDPTLLLNRNQWNKIAKGNRIFKDKYILCYFLNYSFNAFPYVDELAEHIRRQTGFKIVRVARPPHTLNWRDNKYKIGASPEEFLSLVRDAEIVLTTSFHGTAFAVNYGRPVLTIVKSKDSSDSRQVSLMNNLCLNRQIVELESDFPDYNMAKYDTYEEQEKLEKLRKESLEYLIHSLKL